MRGRVAETQAWRVEKAKEFSPLPSFSPDLLLHRERERIRLVGLSEDGG